MTTLAGKGRRSSAARISGRGQRLVVAWSISPQAVTAAGLAKVCEAAQLEIELPLPGEHGHIAARLVVDGSARELNGFSGVPAWQGDDAALVHLDMPGIVHITARQQRPVPQILYARTGLLEELGIRGGRYDFEGAEVRYG